MNARTFVGRVMVGLAGLALAGPAIAAEPPATEPADVTYHTTKVDGVNIFYREAGPKDAPTILLLHGFPSSSSMFRNLIPALSDKYHVIAPDYPGFGQSEQPPAAQFEYTFDHLAQIVDDFTAVCVDTSPTSATGFTWPAGDWRWNHTTNTFTGTIDCP